MKVTVSTRGMKEVEAQLARLKVGTGKAALRRAGITAMRPMAAIAAGLAPYKTGELARSMEVSANAKGANSDVGRSEFATTMRRGGSRSEALAAMRTARRDAKAERGGLAVEVFMGPGVARNADDAIKRVVQEFGTSRMPANPYLRPAWDQDKDAMLERLKDAIWVEVSKAVERAGRRGALRG